MSPSQNVVRRARAMFPNPSVPTAAASTVAAAAAITSYDKMDMEATADQMVTLLSVNPQRV